MDREPPDLFDVFLSHSHEDATIVEELGRVLSDREEHFRVWLDKWVLIPGDHWQQDMARGLEQARTCAVCLGKNTPRGWFKEEIERALNRQVSDKAFRVIPVLLPYADPNVVDGYLELRTWVDFKKGIADKDAIYILACGIIGRAPGRLDREDLGVPSKIIDQIRDNLEKIKSYRDSKLIDDSVAIEYQKRLLDIKFGIGN